MDGSITSCSSLTRLSGAAPGRKGLCRMEATRDSMDCAWWLPSSEECGQAVVAARCCGELKLTSPVTTNGRINSCAPIASVCTRDKTACTMNRGTD